MRQGTLFDSPKYRHFISDRDKALEQIHRNAQTDVSRLLFESLSQIEGIVSHLALHSNKNMINMFSLSQSFEQRTLEIFNHLIYPILQRIQRMRKATFTLANLGELEAIGQATKRSKIQSSHDFKQKLNKQESRDTLNGEELDQRIWIVLMRLRTDILEAFRLALVQKLEPIQIVNKVKASFPKVSQYRQPPRALKPIRESKFRFDQKNDQEASSDFIAQDDWDAMVDAYTETELPPSRFDTENLTDKEAETLNYNWEIEQAMTDDFVQQVRDGQIDAANELGIEDMVWVAIIDDKTCIYCCIPRNGMTTSEIIAALENGDLDKDECDAVTCPAHNKCRCQLAPVASTDEVEGPDWKSFGEWLNS